MLILLRTTSGESMTALLEERKGARGGDQEWFCRSPKVRISKKADGQYEVELNKAIDSSVEEVLEQFLLNMVDAEILQSGGVENTFDESLDEAADIYPYDPETIRIDTKPFNISLVYEMINDGDINLSPDFQRKFVWTDVGARSRLIESIMLRIPLPVFYMAQDRNGTLQVVDGLQRLTVIRQFLNNELRLKDLEYLKSEEGKIYRHNDPDLCIDQRYRKRIMQTQIMVNIIDPQTPVDVKFDIFKRINQGGRPLNAQEIRNCMSAVKTRELIKGLAGSEEFLDATGHSIGVVRMQDHELVLRFLAFRLSQQYGDLDDYTGNMDRFLDQAVDVLNESSDAIFESLREDFIVAMDNAAYLFGEYAFRKCLPEHLQYGARKRLINSALFTMWSLALADYSRRDVFKIAGGAFASYFADELRDNAELFDAVTSGTNDRRRIFYTLSVCQEMCEEYL